MEHSLAKRTRSFNFILRLIFLFTITGEGDVLATSRPERGALAPDFELVDQNGKRWRLRDFRGSVVILNFWATWCGPCIEEIPSMDYLNQYLKSKDVSMIAISVDKTWQDLENFWKQLSRRPSFTVLLDASREVASRLYGADKFPESYIIDREGRVKKFIMGATNWSDEALISELEGILGNFQPANQEKKLKDQ